MNVSTSSVLIKTERFHYNVSIVIKHHSYDRLLFALYVIEDCKSMNLNFSAEIAVISSLEKIIEHYTL